MRQDTKKTVKITSLSLFFVFILVYAFLTSKNLILGVKIKDVNIVNGAKVSENIIEIKGNAKNALNLMLNGREISIDKDGNFHETIILLSGYNMVNIKAKDKFGHIDEENYKLIYKS